VTGAPPNVPLVEADLDRFVATLDAALRSPA
jgi:hypothetical protein